MIQAQKCSEQKGFWSIHLIQETKSKKHTKIYIKTCYQNRGGQYTTEWTEDAPFQYLVNNLPINKQLKGNSTRFPFPLTPTKPNH